VPIGEANGYKTLKPYDFNSQQEQDLETPKYTLTGSD